MWLWNQLETQNKQRLYSRLDPGGEVHFVTYAINSRLYMMGICYFAVEMRSSLLPAHKQGGQWSEAQGGPPAEGAAAVLSAPGRLAERPGCWLLFHSWSCLLVWDFIFILNIFYHNKLCIT